MKKYIGCDNCFSINQLSNVNVKKRPMVIDDITFYITTFECEYCQKVYVVQIDTDKTNAMSLDNIKLLSEIKVNKEAGIKIDVLEKRFKKYDSKLKKIRNDFKRQLENHTATYIATGEKLVIEYLEDYKYE